MTRQGNGKMRGEPSPKPKQSQQSNDVFLTALAAAVLLGVFVAGGIAYRVWYWKAICGSAAASCYATHFAWKVGPGLVLLFVALLLKAVLGGKGDDR